MYNELDNIGFAGRAIFILAALACVNSLGFQREQKKLVVATATAAATYTFKLGGYTVTHVAVGATKPLISGEITETLNADARFFGKYTFEDDGVDSVVVNVVRNNDTITLTTSDVKLSVTTVTSFSEANSIKYAAPVIRVSDSLENGVIPCGNASALETPTYSLDLTYTSGREISLYLELSNGVVINCVTVMATDLATSRTAFVSAFNTAADAAIGVDDIMVAAADGGDPSLVTFEIVVPGLVVEKVHTNFVWEDTTESTKADARKLFVGISERDYSRYNSSGVLAIPPRERFKAISRGTLEVKFEDSPTVGSAVYYNTSTELYTSTPAADGSTVFVPFYKVGISNGTYTRIEA